MGYSFGMSSVGGVTGWGMSNYTPMMSVRMYVGMGSSFSCRGQNIYDSICGAAMAVGNFGLYGDIGYQLAYIRAAFANARSYRASPPEKKSLPPGMDSPDIGDRGAAYIDHVIGRDQKLPSQGSVLKSAYGDKYAEDPENAKRDNKLKFIVENVFDEWMNDPKARGGFLRQWGLSGGDPARMALALFDPKGESSESAYLQMLAQKYNISLLKGDDQGNGEKIADWAKINLGEGVLAKIGVRLALIARAKGYEGETPLVDAEPYISKLVDKNYTRKEAEKIAQGWKNEEDASRAVASLGEQQTDLKGAEEKLKQISEKAVSEGYPQAKKDAEIESYADQIKEAKRRRAERFLQDYVKFVDMRYGVSPRDMGYRAGELPKFADGAGVVDVPTAAAWVQQQLRQRGFDVQDIAIEPEDASATPAATPSGTTRAPRRVMRLSWQKQTATINIPGDGTQYLYKADQGGKTYLAPEKTDARGRLVADESKKIEVTHDPATGNYAKVVPPVDNSKFSVHRTKHPWIERTIQAAMQSKISDPAGSYSIEFTINTDKYKIEFDINDVSISGGTPTKEPQFKKLYYYDGTNWIPVDVNT